MGGQLLQEKGGQQMKRHLVKKDKRSVKTKEAKLEQKLVLTLEAMLQEKKPKDWALKKVRGSEEKLLAKKVQRLVEKSVQKWQRLQLSRLVKELVNKQG